MTTWRSRIRLGAYAVLSTMTLTGALASCGDDDPTTGPNGPDEAEESWTSPLADYLGGGMFNVAGGAGAFGEPFGGDEHEQRQIEDEIAACMRDQGFEYVPYVRDDAAGKEFVEMYRLDPDEFARQYGYGISTVGFGDGDDAGNDDPNEEIRAALSESAAEAYDRALWGDMTESVEVVEGDGEDDDAGQEASNVPEGEPGCWQTAWEQVRGPMDEPNVDVAEFDDLFDDLQALEERISSDPDMVGAVRAWSDCMADAGHPGLDGLDAPQISISDRLSDLLVATPAEGSGSAGEPNASGDGEGSEPMPIDPAQIDEDALAQLRDDEIAIARADRDCRAEHVDAVEQDVRGAMESEFVEANREILERFRDQMAGAAG